MSIIEKRNIDKITHLTQKNLKSLWPSDNLKELKLHTNGENITFECTYEDLKKDLKTYARVTEMTRRTSDQLTAELDWIAYLRNEGLSVASPILNIKNSYLSQFSTGEDNYALSLFKEAPGVQPEKSDLSQELIASKLGTYLAKTHKLTQKYKSNPNTKRHDWSQSPHVQQAAQIISKNNPKMLDEWLKYLEWWKALAKENELFLVHMDSHTGNFNITDSGDITLFDFDDCAFNFFTYDLIVPLLSFENQNPDKNLFQKIETHFLEAYQTEHSIDPIWIKRIPLFKRLRTLEMYAWHIQMFGPPTSQKRIDYFKKLETSSLETMSLF